MSQYTTELRYLAQAEGFDIALDEYPIWDEEYRTILNARILDHYWFREIGQETPERFNWFLRVRMNEIMPRFNRLYLSESLIVNPFYSTNLTESTDRETSGTTEGTATSSANGGTKRTAMQESDTPQGAVLPATLSAAGYLSKASVAEESTPVASTGSQATAGAANSLERFTRSVVGYEGQDQAAMLEAYRRTLLNIDLMVCEALNDLFMMVY